LFDILQAGLTRDVVVHTAWPLYASERGVNSS
jgi:hypothetical protein